MLMGIGDIAAGRIQSYPKENLGYGLTAGELKTDVIKGATTYIYFPVKVAYNVM